MSSRLYTDEEIEEAYQYWAWSSEDSIKKTTDFIGIPERTGYQWAKQHGWRERKKREQADLADPAVIQAQVELKLGLSKVTQQLLLDASNPKSDHRDRLESQKLIYAMTLGTNYDIGKGNTFLSLTDARQIHMQGLSAAGLDPDSLRRMASKAIEANVSMVDAGKNKRPGIVKMEGR